MEDMILHLLQSRDESSIRQMEDFYGPYCSRIAGNILENPEDVEEIISDTWLRAWNSIPPATPRNLKLYLARIARNLAFDRFRSQSRKKRGGGEAMTALDELAECIGTAEGPEAALETKELQKSVNTFLSTLPKRDRQIFLLRYFYAETTEAIANRYAIRPALVRTVLSRTRKKLKTHLIKEGFINE